MACEELSHFDERSGIVACNTEWGSWNQMVGTVTIEVDLPQGVTAKNVQVELKPKSIKCSVKGNIVLQGELYGTIHVSESTWVIEDKKLLRIILSKAHSGVKESIWTSLLKDGTGTPDPLTLHEMRKKLDLEMFQIENPGFDFSSAKLAKCYDKLDEKTTL
ncbi:nudC domain-containing protein 2-like [Bacillus rossius redtenbacheri]|uniref:nudC domain-containing protein 2-like n=1 Tax=Bacillus rossius redtenbacheri TaxID=93214 RepID=UPI002FDE13F8